MTEIVNRVTLEILNKEEELGWQFISPMHDGVYVTCAADHEWHLTEIMERHAQEYGIPIQVTSESTSPTRPSCSPKTRGGKGVPVLGQ